MLSSLQNWGQSDTPAVFISLRVFKWDFSQKLIQVYTHAHIQLGSAITQEVRDTLTSHTRSLIGFSRLCYENTGFKIQ